MGEFWQHFIAWDLRRIWRGRRGNDDGDSGVNEPAVFQGGGGGGDSGKRAGARAEVSVSMLDKNAM